VEAPILICFLSLALWRTLEQWMRGKGLGHCARQLLKEVASVRCRNEPHGPGGQEREADHHTQSGGEQLPPLSGVGQGLFREPEQNRTQSSGDDGPSQSDDERSMEATASLVAGKVRLNEATPTNPQSIPARVL
jgi:hypothetical protein